MTVKRFPYAIRGRNPDFTAVLLRELLLDAEAGILDGVAIAGITVDNKPVLRLAGRLKSRPKEAHWLISVMESQVLKMSLEIKP